MQAHYLDFGETAGLPDLLVCFGQTDREDNGSSDRSSLLQAAHLLNNPLVLNQVKTQKGSRLEKLLTKPDKEVVQELSGDHQPVPHSGRGTVVGKFTKQSQFETGSG